MKTAIIILAAGKGTRMKSRLPKVLHPLAGKPLINHVVDVANGLSDDVVVVTGHGSAQVRESVTTKNVMFVEQEQQLGTGHAVAQALPSVTDSDVILVLYGDVPLIRNQTLQALLGLVNESTMALLSVDLKQPAGYGRILRDDRGKVMAIIEEKDASEEQRQVKEVNTGIMALSNKHLQDWLPQLDNNNVQGEYYLTDLVAIARSNSVSIECRQPDSVLEVEGVNDRIQLARLERYYQLQFAQQLMAEGNTLADPARIDCRGKLVTGTDNFIDINCLFEGEVELGNQVHIGSNCVIKDCRIGDNVFIKHNSVLEGATVGNEVEIGPFARIRPGTVLADKARVGNFVETKNARVGKASKINHLSYVGDAVLGEKVNVGAGTITCNYDGANKHVTEIGDNAFIGSNSALVAPVRIGKGATVGAGSAIAKSVADNSLALTRSKQVEISGWQRPVKNTSNNQ